MGQNVDLRVPEEVADVVRAEANRQFRRPGEILAEFVRVCWPGYVASRLRHDLAHPLDGRIVEARAELTERSEQ